MSIPTFPSPSLPTHAAAADDDDDDDDDDGDIKGTDTGTHTPYTVQSFTQLNVFTRFSTSVVLIFSPFQRNVSPVLSAQ